MTKVIRFPGSEGEENKLGSTVEHTRTSKVNVGNYSAAVKFFNSKNIIPDNQLLASVSDYSNKQLAQLFNNSSESDWKVRPEFFRALVHEIGLRHNIKLE